MKDIFGNEGFLQIAKLIEKLDSSTEDLGPNTCNAAVLLFY